MCGDGRVESPEQCDTPGAPPLSGCEWDCKLSGVVDLKASTNNTCALLVGGYVICWGDNTNNQLGLGHTNSEMSIAPYELTNADGGVAGPINLGGHAMAIAVATYHACALMQDGSVQCWGDNSYGQLGLANTTLYPNSTPNAIGRVQLLDGGTATAIAAGGGSTCAVLTSGELTCWGDNSAGELGLGNTTSMSGTSPSTFAPVDLGSGALAESVSVGYLAACAVLRSGAVKCWGGNGFGQAGIGSTTSPVTAPPTASVPLADATAQMVTAGNGHACALMGGNIQCWGDNSDGELGTGNATEYGASTGNPASLGTVLLPGIGSPTASAVVAGGGHTCALVSNFGLVCWGDNADGELGLASDAGTLGGTTATRPADLPAVSFAAGVSAFSVTLGDYHTCALLSNGSVSCWGGNASAQLGLGYASSTDLFAPSEHALIFAPSVTPAAPPLTP
jgi:alpha-tubulin suppressor-like RCC1 family protein